MSWAYGLRGFTGGLSSGVSTGMSLLQAKQAYDMRNMRMDEMKRATEANDAMSKVFNAAFGPQPGEMDDQGTWLPGARNEQQRLLDAFNATIPVAFKYDPDAGIRMFTQKFALQEQMRAKEMQAADHALALGDPRPMAGLYGLHVEQSPDGKWAVGAPGMAPTLLTIDEIRAKNDEMKASPQKRFELAKEIEKVRVQEALRAEREDVVARAEKARAEAAAVPLGAQAKMITAQTGAARERRMGAGGGGGSGGRGGGASGRSAHVSGKEKLADGTYLLIYSDGRKEVAVDKDGKPYRGAHADRFVEGLVRDAARNPLNTDDPVEKAREIEGKLRPGQGSSKVVDFGSLK